MDDPTPSAPDGAPEPPPDEKSSDDSLGARIERFRPMLLNTLAFALVGVVMVLGGIAVAGIGVRDVFVTGGDMPLYASRGDAWIWVVLLILLGVGLVFGGVYMVKTCRRLLVHAVELHEGGFVVTDADGTKKVRLAAVLAVVETVTHEKMNVTNSGLVNSMLPRTMGREIKVKTRRGDEYDFDDATVEKIKRFGRMLKERTDPLGVPWETIEVAE